MLKLKIIGTYNYSEQLTVEQFAIYSILINFANKDTLNFSQLSNQIKLDEEDFIEILISLKEKKLINFRKQYLLDEIYLEISNGVPATKTIEPYILELENIFSIDSNYLTRKLKNIDNDNARKMIIFQNALETINSQEITAISIDSQDDYIKYLQEIKPLEIWKLHSIPMTLKDCNYIYDLVIIQKNKKEIINLAIDYTISTSKYNNVYFKFVNTILSDWKSKKLDTLIEIIEYLQKQKLEKESGFQIYEEPVYEKATDEMEVKEEEIENLLDNLFD